MSVVMTGRGHKSNTRRTNSLQVYLLHSVQGFRGENISDMGPKERASRESTKKTKGRKMKEGDEE